MPTPTPPARPAPFRPPPLLIGAGILVIVVGFGLPYLTPSTPAPPSNPEPAVLPAHNPTPPAPAAAPGLGAALARLVGCLVAVCGGCVLVARWVGRKAPAPTGTMQVLAALPLDARCTVYLVRAGDRRMLIGTDHAGVKALVELPGPAAEPPAEPAAPPGHDEVTVLVARLGTGATAG